MQSRIVAWSIAGSLVVALLAGCSAGEEPDPTPVSTRSTSGQDASAPDPTNAPEVAAATGGALTLQRSGVDVVTFRAPSPAWDASGSSATRVSADGAWYLSGLTGPSDPEITLDNAALAALDVSGGRFAGLRRVDDRTVAGVDGYVIEGGAGKELYYEFGAIRGDAFVTISFELPVDTPASREVVEIVLAGVTWT